MASKMKQLHLLETEHSLLQNKASEQLLLLCAVQQQTPHWMLCSAAANPIQWILPVHCRFPHASFCWKHWHGVLEVPWPAVA